MSDSVLVPKFADWKHKIVSVISVVLVSFHVYTSLFGMLDAVLQRGVCLSLILSILFLTKPTRIKAAGPLVDIVFIVMSIASTLYTILNYDAIIARGGQYVTIEVVLGTMLIIALAEGSRRALGLSLTMISGVAMLYCIFGYAIPILNLGFRRLTFSRIIYNQVYTTEGIYSAPLGAVATFVIVFLLFAEVLDATGAREFLMDFALAAFGKKRGGAAKVAVVSSGLFGMVSGSSVANVVSTGVITIPLMKKSGFTPKLAGAIEACASTGGMLAPPIMGAAAFVMAEVLGVSYLVVLKASIIPAILYYAAIYLVIEFKTQDGGTYTVTTDELGIKGMNKWLLFKKLLVVAIPIGTMIFLMNKWTVQKAVMFSIGIMIILAIMMKTGSGLRHPVKICEGTARHAVSVAMATALGGVVVGVISFTGFGFKVSTLLIGASGGYLLPLCLLSMLASIIFGMGLPPTACYILIALLVAPVMVSKGVEPLAAHMFAFYFGILSNITPPVAVASYAAAAIAEEKPMKVGWQGFLVMLILCLIPYGFIYYPAMLLVDGWDLASLLVSVITVSIAVVMGSVAVGGCVLGKKLNYIYRFGFAALAALTLVPAVALIAKGLVFALLAGYFAVKRKKLAAKPSI